MYFVIGADLVPTESNAELFKNGNAAELVGEELYSILKNAAYRVFNLEVPLTDEESPIIKFGPNLIAPTATITGYNALEINLLTLSNNHILDQGAKGLMSTMALLEKNGIAYVGAGNDIEKAQKPYLFSFGEKKIGVYACVEHEFSIAGEAAVGANPFDPLCSLDHVAELKRQCDFVIVLYHGGKEHYRYPSPRLRTVCRKLVEKGADLVLCQHSHCIGCEEKYGSGTIVYGQGNFLFDLSESEYWQTSLLVKIDEDMNVSYIPLVKQNNTVRLAEGEEKDKILNEYHHRSEEIKNPGFVEKKYAEFAEEFMKKYLMVFQGKESFLFRVMNKLSGNRLREKTMRSKYNQKHLLGMRNYVECEAHNELFLAGINGRLFPDTKEQTKSE